MTTTQHQVFRGRTLTEARRAAFEALGGGAVFLTTREVRKPGFAGFLGSKEVEVVAEAPSSPPPRAVTPQPSPAAGNTGFRRNNEGLFATGAYQPSIPPADAPTANAPNQASVATLRTELRTELRALKAAVTQPERIPPDLMAELAALRVAVEEVAQEPRKGDRSAALLRSRGIEGPVATALARSMKRLEDGTPAHERLREALTEVVKVAPWPLAVEERTLIGLVGPTGVGKTTTIAKLAAHARMAKRSVTLIACDGFRVGAVEQLRRYAALLGADFATANTRDELAARIEAAETDLVLVDTAGRAPKPGGPESLLAADAFRRVSGAPLTRHVLLCLPAALRLQDATGMMRAFAPIAPTALAITKLDETAAPSGLVHGPFAAKLPVSVLCAGQRVPEHIAPATAGAILDLLAPRPGARA